MLYTRKGDSGTTKTYGCDQRMSKSSAVAEALGVLDETNSFLGLVKVHVKAGEFKIGERSFQSIVHEVQQSLFMIQAQVAGYPMDFGEGKVKELELLVDTVEKMLSPIKTFFISGGTDLAVLCDVARTIARRAERRVVAVVEGEVVNKSETKSLGIQPTVLAYLNRLSSLLYALARLSNHLSGIKEESPAYK